MGVSRATAEFLVEARHHGVDFTRTATIGRQALFVGPRAVEKLLRAHGLTPPAPQEWGAEPGWLEPFLRALGAQDISAIDASSYEGADIVHDLNQPVPAELHERFSVLFDGGTLEHVFDVPEALRSYMQMVEVGGRLIVHTMANNYLGHGFYQFSPELFFRVLSPENGYELERVVLVENDLLWTSLLRLTTALERRHDWYEVRDPAEAHSRILLQNRRPVVMHVQAQRVAAVEPFTRPPQQSDYVGQWEAEPVPGRTPWTPLDRLPPYRRAVVQWDLLPKAYWPLYPVRALKELRARSFRNSRWYRRVR